MTRLPAYLAYSHDFQDSGVSGFLGLCVLPHPGLRVVTNKTSPTLLLAKPVSQPTHQHRPLSYFQSERGQISPRVLTL